MKALIIKINMDNPEVLFGLGKLYRRLLKRRSDDSDAVKVVFSLTCYGQKREEGVFFKVKLSEDDIAFIRGITETVQDIESILKL